MENFLVEISEDINWRLGQLATIKTLPFRYSITNDHKNFLLKYLIPSCYAVWEGFVKNTFEIYTRYLNSLSIKMDKFSISIVSHSIERTFPQLRNEINDQRKIEHLCESLFNYAKNNFSVSSLLPTNSNINLKIINNILSRYNLALLPTTPYKNELNKLIHFRNLIAHGDNNIVVTKDIVFEFTNTINHLMSDIFLLVEEGYNNKTYLREQ